MNMYVCTEHMKYIDIYIYIKQYEYICKFKYICMCFSLCICNICICVKSFNENEEFQTVVACMCSKRSALSAYAKSALKLLFLSKIFGSSFDVHPSMLTHLQTHLDLWIH